MSLLSYVAQADVHDTTCFRDATGCCDHRSFTVRLCFHYFIFVIIFFRVQQDVELYTVKICFFKSYHSVLLLFEMYIIIAVRVGFSRSRRCFQPRVLNFSEIGLEIERYQEKCILECFLFQNHTRTLLSIFVDSSQFDVNSKELGDVLVWLSVL